MDAEEVFVNELERKANENEELHMHDEEEEAQVAAKEAEDGDTDVQASLGGSRKRSAVIAANTEAKEAREPDDQSKSDEHPSKRRRLAKPKLSGMDRIAGRNLLNVISSTLKNSSKDVETISEINKKRTELQLKSEKRRAERLERYEEKRKEEKLMKKELERQELRKKQVEMTEVMERYWQKKWEALIGTGAIRTETEPHIFYKPRILDEEHKKRVEETRNMLKLEYNEAKKAWKRPGDAQSASEDVIEEEVTV